MFERIGWKEKKSDIETPEEMAEKLDGPFEHPEVIEAFENLSEQIGDRFGDYETIISDDASGRLPSLVLRKLISRVREEESKKSPDTFFVVGGMHPPEGTEEAVRGFLEKTLEEKGDLGKTLIVSEYIGEGISISELMETLKQLGVDYDFATVSSWHGRNGDEYSNLPRLKELIDKGSIFIGSDNNSREHDEGYIIPGMRFNRINATGVTTRKSKGSAHPGKEDARPSSDDRQAIVEARESADLLADWLYRKLKEKNNITS